MKICDLVPYNGRKSFYGKAKVFSFDDGWTLLKSYGTVVAGIDPYGGKRRFWEGRSPTTGCHVASFFENRGIVVKAKEFFKWPVDRVPIEHADADDEQ